MKIAANLGHDLANKAHSFEGKADWYNALIAHDKAAIEFEKAIKDTSDVESKRILQALARNHSTKAKELKRRLEQPDATTAFDMKKLELEIHAIQSGELGAHVVHEPIGDSFALLPNEEDDAEDPFNKFWGVVEPMMNKLSTPLHVKDESALNATSETNVYEVIVDEEETSRIEREMASIIESFFVSPASTKKIEEDQYTHQTHSTDFERDPKIVNGELKAQVQQLTNQIQNLEKRSVDSTVLKSSIVQFKSDVHKQALRILQTQDTSMMTRSATTTGSPLVKNIRTLGTSTAEIFHRIKELEDENRNLRSQNRKQDALMHKYRERWEKLKEGAKKRHPASVTAPTNPTLLRSLASNNPPALSSIDK
ncbi:hypothetical protein INT47_003131 [Mucor saturninus]|uniref:Uncharacterized protein n=1 Tax=Mucor saturninus TaxID=64648 RepID=A0A8H7USY7_9FUNG|nr:hypothetical protein INT47_003131 [Mucor saturninus]